METLLLHGFAALCLALAARRLCQLMVLEFRGLTHVNYVTIMHNPNKDLIESCKQLTNVIPDTVAGCIIHVK